MMLLLFSEANPAGVLLERIRNARTAESPQRAHKRRKSPA